MSQYKLLLLQISDELSQRDLKSLVFFCEVPESTAEKIACGIDLFQHLKHQNQLGPGEYSYLRKGLMAVGRVDLAKKLPSELEAVLRQVPLKERSFMLTSEFTMPAISSPVPGQEAIAAAMPRAQLLQIAERLTSDNVSKLAYLVADRLSLDNDTDKLSALQLLHQLESTGIINPSSPDSLASLLHLIGRKDLASLLLSLQAPQFIRADFTHTQQLLGIKFSMFTEIKARYSFQRKLIAVFLSSDNNAIMEQILKPMISVVRSCDYSFITNLCRTTLESSQPWNLINLVNSTLPLIFDSMDARKNALHHYLGCEGNLVKISLIQPPLQACYENYKKFEENIGNLNWNTIFRKHFKKDVSQHKIPVGSPAHTAVTCIYDICSELSGKENVEPSRKNANESIFTLDWIFYSYSYRIVMIQWLESVLFFVMDDKVPVPFALHKTLLQIASKYQHQISTSYRELENVIGEETTKRIAERLRCEGITIEDGSSIDDDFTAFNITPIYLMLLLQLSYFGGKDIELRTIISKIQTFYYRFVSSEQYGHWAFRLCMIQANTCEFLIEKFKDEVLRSDILCAPALKYFFDI